MVEIIVSRYGEVPESFIETLERVLATFYGSRPEPPFVEVVVYGPGRSPSELLYEEAAALGVLVLGSYPVSHEAWMGWPRIHVDYRRCSELDEETLEAILVHEAAHSVLHGSRDYYLLRVGEESLEPLGVYALEALYVASTVVKDLEVHRYLVESGYREHVERYAEYSVGGASGLDCSSLPGVLTLAKLASPCIYVDCPDLPRHLGSDCAGVVGALVEALDELRSSGEDWSERSVRLVRVAADLLSRLPSGVHRKTPG